MRGLPYILKKRRTTVKEEDFLAFIKEKENYKIMNTPKTIKLYDVTPYETTFTANVLSCEECEQHNTDAGKTLSSAAQPQYKTYKLILDQTLFFGTQFRHGKHIRNRNGKCPDLLFRKHGFDLHELMPNRHSAEFQDRLRIAINAFRFWQSSRSST